MTLPKCTFNWPFKRRRIKERSTVTVKEFPKLLVVHSDTDKPMNKMSLFLVLKVLGGQIGKTFKAKFTSTGDLLVK